MDLLEYQGKEVFRRYDVPAAPEGVVCETADEVEAAARKIDRPVVVKAQVKTGGRGKAGGVKLADTPGEARQAGEEILGLDIKGHTVEIVYVEPASDIAEEYYLSILHDREEKGYLVICSAEGGVDIEQVNRESPEKVVKHALTPTDTTNGLSPSTAEAILEQAQIPEEVRGAAVNLLVKLFAAFHAGDLLLAEINPLVRTADDRVIALDSKVTIDNNAMFRHDEYEGYAEFDQRGEGLEAEAKRKGIQYVKLNRARGRPSAAARASVGVLGNGAGLVMATIDVVAQAGGDPANFLDVGGGASADEMAESLSVVLGDPQVTSVLINIYGGITRGEEVAAGILEALDRLGDIEQKLVVRLDGTNAEEGRRILAEADHPNIIPAADMAQAAEKAVELAG